MNLAQTMTLLAGGEGSGCNPKVAKPRCGRPKKKGGGMVTVYHGTSSELVRALKKKGLVSGSEYASEYSGDDAGKVFVSTDRSSADQWARQRHEDLVPAGVGHPVVVELQVPKALYKKFKAHWTGHGDKEYAGSIPAKYIKRVRKVKDPYND